MHVSCLAEQAKILVAEAVENNLGNKVLGERWARWHTCSLCEQDYHSVVAHALGWACWKTYLGRPETDMVRSFAMRRLGNGLGVAGHFRDALSVQEAEMALKRRIGANEDDILVAQGNIAITYKALGRLEEALSIKRDVYSGRLRLNGEEHEETLREANNYASTLIGLDRFEEAKSLLRKTIPVARRVLGESREYTLRMRWCYGQALYKDPAATLDALREAVTTLEEIEPIARRLLGGAHPLVMVMQQRDLKGARAALAARETPEAEKLAQDAFRTARAKVAQERLELADAMAAMTTGDA